MRICLERSERVLQVLLSDVELAKKQIQGGFFRRRYGSSRGVVFTFEKRAAGLSLYIGFGRYKDERVLSRVSRGRPVAELQMLSRLAHLPCARIYVAQVSLPDGRDVHLIDTVKFPLQEIADGFWESGGIESEVAGLRRQMTLDSLRDRLPGIYFECGPDATLAGKGRSAGSEAIFARRVKEIKLEAEIRRNLRKDKGPKTDLKVDLRCQKEAPAGHVLPAKGAPADLPPEREPRVAPPVVLEKRDPDEIAECDGCDELCCERELIEVKPGVYVCKSCGDDYATLEWMGLTTEEMERYWRLLRCDWCGQPLTAIEPGGWLCPVCFFLKSVVPPAPIDRERGLSAPVFEAMRLLKTRIDIPIGPGKVIPAGTWIIGVSVADGWKIGAGCSFAVESIWRGRERAGFDKGPLVKVDIDPSMIVHPSAVTQGACICGAGEEMSQREAKLGKGCSPQ